MNVQQKVFGEVGRWRICHSPQKVSSRSQGSRFGKRLLLWNIAYHHKAQREVTRGSQATASGSPV